MIVLVPPSEGKADGGTGVFGSDSGTFGPTLAARRCAVVDAVMTDLARDGASKRLFGTTGPLADRAVGAFTALATGSALALPAWRRYTGVVWTHLDPKTLTKARRRQLVIPSALMGLTTGEDPVPDYRLKLSVSPSTIGPLHRWWRDAITAALIAHGRGPIIDLLPHEHAAAIDWPTLSTHRKVIRVDFLADDATGAAGHAAKAVKGVFARMLLTDGLAPAPAFDWQGWTCERGGPRHLVVTAP